MKIATGVAGVLGIATGATLALAPKRLFEPSEAVGRWLLGTDVGELFDRRYTIERRVYRRHRIVGGVVLAGAAAALTLILFLSIDPRSAPIRKALGRFEFRTLVAVAATIACVLVVFGLCLLVRPSLLKGLETAANRWIDASARAKRFDVSRLVLRAPRLVGMLLLVGGFACLWRV